MHHYSQGKPTRQAHKGIPENQYEEEQGLLGFFGPVSHLLRKKPSTRWTEIDGPLKPQLFDTLKIPGEETEHRLLFNSATTVSLSHQPSSKPGEMCAKRNADGDLLYFCHKGKGFFFSEYGMIEFSAGDYIVVPKCITHVMYCSEPSVFLNIENRNSHYQEPDRGVVGRHAIYDINAIAKPNLEEQEAKFKELDLLVNQVRVKRLDTYTTFKYDSEFFDVVGWKGDLFPYRLSMDHMMPLMSHRAHLPPSAHSTFVARDFVVCTFLPRPLEEDKDALKVPFYHQNIDYDEVLFYHAGDFFSRDNLHAGMMTLHPAGFPHGPHPKAIQAVEKKTHTDEYAVMIDSRIPFEVDPVLRKTEVSDYWKSWQVE